MTDARRDGRREVVRDGRRIDPQLGYAFIRAHQDRFPLAAMCRALNLSPSGYYDWVKRPPSKRARRDDELRDRIRTIWNESNGTYGRPRIHAALREEGVRVGQKRVARLMKSMGIHGRGYGTRIRRGGNAGQSTRNGSGEAHPG